MTARKPDPRQCAMLLLRMIESREEERKTPMSRVRLAELTLKRLWKRQRLEGWLLSEVQEELLPAGWALMFAGSTYGAIKVSAVESWPRVSSKRIEDQLDAVSRGEFDFSTLEHLLDAKKEETDYVDDDGDDEA